MGIFDKVMGLLGGGRNDDSDERMVVVPAETVKVEVPDADDFYGSDRPETGYRPIMADWMQHRPVALDRAKGDDEAFGREYRAFFGIEQTTTPTLDQIADAVVEIANAWPNHVMDGLRHGAGRVSPEGVSSIDRHMGDENSAAGISAYDRSQFLMQRAVLDISWNNPDAADVWKANAFKAVQAAGIISGNPEVSDVPEQLHDDMLRAVDVKWASLNREGRDDIDLNSFAKALDQEDWSAHLATRTDGVIPTEEERSLFFLRPVAPTTPTLEEIAVTVSDALSSQPPQMDDLRYGDLMVSRDVADRIETRVSLPDMTADAGDARYRYAMTEVVSDLRGRLPEFDETLRTRADETMSHHLPDLRMSGVRTSRASDIQDAVIERAAQNALHFTMEAGGLPRGMDGFEDPHAIARAITSPIDVASTKIERQITEISGPLEQDRTETRMRDAGLIGAMMAGRQTGR